MPPVESINPRCLICGGTDFLGVESSELCADCLWEDHLAAIAYTAPVTRDEPETVVCVAVEALLSDEAIEAAAWRKTDLDTARLIVRAAVSVALVRGTGASK